MYQMINLIAKGTMSSLHLYRFSMAKLVLFLASIFLYSIVFGQGAPQRTNDITQKDNINFGNYNLPKTGILDDDDTKNLIIAPGSGVKDISRNVEGRREKRYTRPIYNPKWQKHHLTWSFRNESHRLNATRIREELSAAFGYWSSISELQFEEINSTSADILIYFYRLDHGDGMPFDGKGNTLAHSLYPQQELNNAHESYSGDMHFDDDEPWSLDEQNMSVVYFFNVAVHEIGHALGLDHSLVEGSVMNPRYNYTGKRFTGLSDDEKNAMKDIYGIK